MSKFRINPQWQEHNDIYNEGGDGFNPYNRWISAPSTQNNNDKKYCLDGAGSPKTLQEWRVDLAKSEERLEKITDKFGIEIVKKSIESIKALIDSILANEI